MGPWVQLVLEGGLYGPLGPIASQGRSLWPLRSNCFSMGSPYGPLGPMLLEGVPYGPLGPITFQGRSVRPLGSNASRGSSVWPLGSNYFSREIRTAPWVQLLLGEGH